jgi:hypothetical protein
LNNLHANSAFQKPLADGIWSAGVSSVPAMRREDAARPR